MAGTFSQIYIQIVFGVKNRAHQIDVNWEADLYKYITGIVQNKGQKLIAINGMPDHIHILIEMKPTCCLSDLVREIKKSSSAFIKDKKYTKTKFEWQAGYGAFSYSHSSLENVTKYIENQKIHHKTKSFQDEYREFIVKYNIDFEERFLFD